VLLRAGKRQCCGHYARSRTAHILLSALIPHHGFPDKIYRAWRSARFEVVTSDERLEEIRRAIRYPKFKEVLQPTRVGTIVNNLQRTIILERLNIEIEAEDPDDAFLLAIAISGGAYYLVL
jgi:putative PIN family toxin of toxin-antitoxin system